MRYAQLVMGPAGSGKTTYCSAIVKHAETMGRTVHIINLDPATENCECSYAADIKDLIQLEDVMEDKQLHFGPNGGLLFCMQYLADNVSWLEECLADGDNDYFLFDCPGQIELFIHIPAMRRIVDALQSWNFRVCGIFLLDAQFMLEMGKFFAGTLMALSAMASLELPHINVLSKMDLLGVQNRDLIDRFLEPDIHLLDVEEETSWNQKYGKLTKAIANTVNDYSLVRFLPLDITDEDSISDLLLTIDTTIQYAEDQDIKDDFPEEIDASAVSSLLPN